MSAPDPRNYRPGEKRPTLGGALFKMAAVIVGLFAIFFFAEWASYTVLTLFAS